MSKQERFLKIPVSAFGYDYIVGLDTLLATVGYPKHDRSHYVQLFTTSEQRPHVITRRLPCNTGEIDVKIYFETIKESDGMKRHVISLTSITQHYNKTDKALLRTEHNRDINLVHDGFKNDLPVYKIESEKPRWIKGTFTEIDGDSMFCPIDGSIKVDADDEILDINIGGAIDSRDLPDCCEFEFTAENGDEWFR